MVASPENYTVPATVQIDNNGSKEKQINISGVNQFIILQPGAGIKVTALSSSEIFGYLSQITADPELAIEITRETASEE